MEARSSLGAFLAGAGLGALGMYFLDPDSARRRQALVRDQLVHAVHEARDAARVAQRDVANRVRGLVAETRSWVTPDDASDAVVAERIRAIFGQWVSHPRAIRVEVTDGVATLEGPVLAAEADGLRRAVRHVRGVRDLVDRLEVHEDAAGIPALQGGVPRTGPRSELLQARPSPAARLLMAAAGLAANGTALRLGAERGR